MIEGKVPPYSLEAEQSVLGAILLNSNVMPNVVEHISPSDFYRPDHQQIFSAIFALYEKNKPIDLVTVVEQLTSEGNLESAGGVDYLASLVASVPTAANAGNYAEIIAEKSALRQLIQVAGDIAEESFNGNGEASDIMSHAERLITDILKSREMGGLVHIRSSLNDAIAHMKHVYENNGKITGVPTGFTDLDEKLGGLQNSDLILIAARPAMGKTSLALNIAEYAATHGTAPVAVFSLEMGIEQLVNRLIWSQALVSGQKVRRGELDANDWKEIAQAMAVLSQAPLYIDDSAGIKVAEIRAKCKQLQQRHGLGMVVIDYLQLIQESGRGKNRQEEIASITRTLKIMAKELNVPVVVLSQLSRAAESRTDHRPMLSDLRESGAIEQDADIVLFLYREDYYKEDTDRPGIAECIVAKHRNGSTGTVELKWLGEYTKFANLSKA